MTLRLEDIVTSSGQFADRWESLEFTPQVLSNAQVLKGKVNALLFDLGIKDVRVSSGFRPTVVNSSDEVKGAKASAHLTGMGLDLVDKDKKIKQAIVKAPHLLAKHGLWMENPDDTPTWCHLDYKTRPERLIRIFKP